MSVAVFAQRGRIEWDGEGPRFMRNSAHRVRCMRKCSAYRTFSLKSGQIAVWPILPGDRPGLRCSPNLRVSCASGAHAAQHARWSPLSAGRKRFGPPGLPARLVLQRPPLGGESGKRVRRHSTTCRALALRLGAQAIRVRKTPPAQLPRRGGAGSPRCRATLSGVLISRLACS